MKKRWILQTKKADFNAIAKKYSVHPVTAKCMVNRGVTTEEQIAEYLQGTCERLSSPWLMKDMEKAIDVILAYKDKGAAIASDFDCDGIFAAFILKKSYLYPRSCSGRVRIESAYRG